MSWFLAFLLLFCSLTLDEKGRVMGVAEDVAICDFTQEAIVDMEKKGEHTVTIRDKEFIILPNVASPLIFQDSLFYAGNIPLPEKGTFLEVGSGAGVIAICAAIEQNCTVTAVDKNPQAVTNTRLNAKKLGVANHVEAYESDVFSAVPEGKTFDTIFWALPFTYIEKEDLSPLESAAFDSGYRSLNRYFRDAKSYLSAQGRLFFGFSSRLGNQEALKAVAGAYGWSLELIKVDFDEWGYPFELYEATFTK